MSTHNIPFSVIKEKNPHPKLSQICSCRFFSWGLENELETVVVIEPSVFKPLKFYCIRNCRFDADAFISFQPLPYEVAMQPDEPPPDS